MSEMDDLAAFAVLIEAGSFTLAAQQLGCSKGQLSKRISLLETRFSVVLLQRTTRRLSLTAAGAARLPQAQALVVQVETARQALARLNGSGLAGGNLLRWLVAGIFPPISRGADRVGPQQ
jgi:DNA-binding transcriptional LysR family regulator